MAFVEVPVGAPELGEANCCGMRTRKITILALDPRDSIFAVIHDMPTAEKIDRPTELTSLLQHPPPVVPPPRVQPLVQVVPVLPVPSAPPKSDNSPPSSDVRVSEPGSMNMLFRSSTPEKPRFAPLPSTPLQTDNVSDSTTSSVMPVAESSQPSSHSSNNSQEELMPVRSASTSRRSLFPVEHMHVNSVESIPIASLPAYPPPSVPAAAAVVGPVSVPVNAWASVNVEPNQAQQPARLRYRLPMKSLIESPLLTQVFAAKWFMFFYGSLVTAIAVMQALPVDFSWFTFTIWCLLYLIVAFLSISRIEVSILLRQAFFTFEAMYLLFTGFMLFTLSAYEYALEFETFGVALSNISYTEYVMRCTVLVVSEVSVFFFALFSDAVPKMPRPIKIFLHFIVIICAVWTWITGRFLYPSYTRSPELCLGSVEISCTDVWRLRMTFWLIITVFFVRNTVALILQNDKDSRFLLIKAAVNVHVKEFGDGDNNSIESTLPALPSVASVMPVQQLEVPVRAETPPPGSTTESSTYVRNSMAARDPSEVAEKIVIMSNFHEIDSHARPHEPLLGVLSERLWSLPGFPAFAIFNLASCLALVSLNEPTSFVMLIVCYIDVGIITFTGSALIDIRILKYLTRTFEFWFLQIFNVVTFGIEIYETYIMLEGMAAFHNNSMQVQLYGEWLWAIAGWTGTTVVICFDALMVRRAIKLAMCLVWAMNTLRQMYSIVFIYSTRAYMVPMNFCIYFECWSAEVVRLQIACTVLVYLIKYAVSLILFPESMIILKSPVSYKCTDKLRRQRVAPQPNQSDLDD